MNTLDLEKILKRLAKEKKGSDAVMIRGKVLMAYLKKRKISNWFEDCI